MKYTATSDDGWTQPQTAWIAGENGKDYEQRETYSPAEHEIWVEYVKEFSSPLQHKNYKEWLRAMRSIIFEMGSQQQADARRHIGDACWEAMVLLDIPRRYHYYDLSDIKNLNWDLVPIKASSPCNACRASKYPCHYTNRDAANDCRECYLQGKTCSLGNNQRANRKRTRADSIEDEDDEATDSKGKQKEHSRKKRKVESEEDNWDLKLIKRLELQLEEKERQVASLSDERNRIKQCYDESTNHVTQLQQEASQQKLRAEELEAEVLRANEVARTGWEHATSFRDAYDAQTNELRNLAGYKVSSERELEALRSQLKAEHQKYKQVKEKNDVITAVLRK